MTTMQYSLPPTLDNAVSAALRDWQKNDKTRRLWARDAYLWSGSDEAQWLDWLTIVQEQLDGLGVLQEAVGEIVAADFRHLVLLGMGGSSLCPDVLRETFGHIGGYPRLLVLDSTDPAQVAGVADTIDMERTLFIVSSKSGSTLEPNILLAYFFRQVVEAVGDDEAASRFIAITDPGSDLERQASEAGFRHIFHGKPQIGGRFSALSAFGIVPAAIMGLDVGRFLTGARQMVKACGEGKPAEHNPGVLLGVILGVAATQGRDKMTLFTSPGIVSLGGWLEQLVAESTGKSGKGIIPVDGEDIGSPDSYGDDRVFVYLRLGSVPDAAQDAAVGALEAAGQPVVRITLADTYLLGAEFFRWEIATAVAGAILGINPFDQPDVEASKIETRKLTSVYAASGSLPAEHPVLVEGDLSLYTNHRNAESLFALAGSDASLASLVNAHLARAGSGDYVALLAYLARNATHDSVLQTLRHRVRDSRRVATCVGFGPRFLHSTGQAYKGGPNSGVFLQITCDHERDLPVPGHAYTFGIVEAAQARGDFEVLAERKRRVLRVHLGGDAQASLERLQSLVSL
jgi:transaldolase/glucose-6-phosphate isomerase